MSRFHPNETRGEAHFRPRVFNVSPVHEVEHEDVGHPWRTLLIQLSTAEAFWLMVCTAAFDCLRVVFFSTARLQIWKRLHHVGLFRQLDVVIHPSSAVWSYGTAMQCPVSLTGWFFQRAVPHAHRRGRASDCKRQEFVESDQPQRIVVENKL